MRLSNAIALGVPEIKFGNDTGFGWYWKDEDGTCGGCLVGAALYSVGAENGKALTRFAAKWPWTKEAKVQCPVCHANREFPTILTDLVIHYKEGRINLPKICDFIRSIEPPEPEETTETVTAEKVHVAA